MESSAFGETTIKTQITSNNLRFPGQYADSAIGLNQNYFRDYVPSLGKYLEVDPIGLKGGVNTYVYAGQNPLMFVDVLGLEYYGCNRVLDKKGMEVKDYKESWGDWQVLWRFTMCFPIPFISKGKLRDVICYDTVRRGRPYLAEWWERETKRIALYCPKEGSCSAFDYEFSGYLYEHGEWEYNGTILKWEYSLSYETGEPNKIRTPPKKPQRY